MSKQIPLSGKRGKGKFAIVDDEDFEIASAYTWSYSKGYAVTSVGGRKDKKRIYLHRLISGDPPEGLFVDHIDGDPLNNQRNNLRFVTIAQNAYNMAPNRNTSSSFKGVSWDSSRNFWHARIQFDKATTNLGFFMSELDAARAYNVAAIKHFGEYARLNVIPDDAKDDVRYRQATPIAHNRTSRFRGVHFSTKSGCWISKITIRYKTIHLGSFDTEEEAARAYDAAAKIHHGKRAFLNFPDLT